MAKDYQLIQAQTLTSSASSITFSNIPQNFTDLILKISARTNYAAVNDYIYMSLNGNTSLNSYNMIYGDGSSTAGYNGSGAGNGTGMAVANGATSTASTFSNCEVYIPNYAGSTAKSASVDAVIENNATATVMELLSYLNTGTSAITTIALTPGNGPNFVANSTFALYGVGGSRATGGTITSDANYTYHTFTSTSTFTPLEKIKNAEVLMVAGGGSGGYTISNGGGGGGGAGGVSYTAGQTLYAGTSYTALIGAGGATATSSTVLSGSNSQFSSLTAAVGGGGGGGAGATGGSGGGGGDSSSGGSATTGQGNAGGAGQGQQSAGGGGGAGTVGTTGYNNAGGGGSGPGGLGTSSYTYWHYATSTGVSSGGTYFIAGGGGGGNKKDTPTGAGAGGLGGGGAGGAALSAGTAGTANTGGGGGGGSSNYPSGSNGGAGGSGLIIIRYPSI